ncbi:serine hydrolase domain-containing protein [Streptomyces sp. JV184]|uniref:serine hydrolase domain-containing protein n=1 Tax=Streptomyces sp. JV184 TaxID=858637 RepID=UPI003FA788BB
MRNGQSRANRPPLTRTVRRTALLATAVALLAAAVPGTAFAASGTNATHRAALPGHCATARGALADRLDTLVARDGIPGVAAEVTGPDCGRWTVARGVADRDTGRPMRTEDRLRIGSITKTFTATVVVQLAAEGRIALDAPVERYLPGLIRGNGYDGRRTTVRQLLQHTSGLPDHVDAIAGQPLKEWRLRHYEPRELVALALTLPHPESTWSYSTTNYVLAGLIVEQVTGHRVEAEVNRRIVRPLGLRDTYWPGDRTGIQGPHSHSYFPDPDPGAPDGSPLRDGTTWNMTIGGAGGALVSTPADLNRFYRGLFDGRLLPARWLAEMKRTVPADPQRLWPGARYGLGLISSPLSCGGQWWGHGGTVPGGHRALGAVGPDGSGVALALTKVPDTDRAEEEFLAAIDTALCHTRNETGHPDDNPHQETT